MGATGSAALDEDAVVALVTDRLILRTFRGDDLEAFATLNADPEVMRYLGGHPLERSQSDAIAIGAQRAFAAERFGKIAIERRSDGAFLGTCGLSREPWYPEDLEIGWRLARRYWGNGYATEAGLAWLGHAFAVLRAPRVISITDVPNRRSIAVMERLGLTPDHAATLEDDGGPFDAVIHAISAESWRARVR